MFPSITAINPFYATRMGHRHALEPRAAETESRAVPARYVKLPRAPRNASPVPGLTSLYHNADPGPYGDRAYPGNCSGNLIKDLLRFFAADSVYDPMSGSGTCRDVCRELGLDCYSGDIRGGFDACEPHFDAAFAFGWLHPPYWRQKLYTADPRDLSRAPTLDAFLARYRQLIVSCARAIEPGGHLAILMGDYYDRKVGFVPLVYWTKALAFEAGLRQCATDIVRFSHGASSGRKVYRSRFIPGLHDVCVVFSKP